MPIARLYYECHITVEPLYEATRQAEFAETCADFGFRPAKLLMQKGNTLETSHRDAFATTRGSDYDDVRSRMERCIIAIRSKGISVWRYKIEDTLLDSRDDKDPLSLLR